MCSMTCTMFKWYLSEHRCYTYTGVDRLESGRFPSSVHFGGATHREVGEQGLGWGSKGGGGGECVC